MFEAFKEDKFYGKSKVLITRANRIIEKYQGMGHRMTVRQLYYRFVAGAEGQPIENTIKSYKRFAHTISEARLCGLIDWDAIEDRGRIPKGYGNGGMRTPQEFMESLKDAWKGFRKNPWPNQPHYIELWVEKQALEGQLSQIAAEHWINFCSNKGYSSQTAMYDASKRFIARANDGKICTLLYCGDHDPSGEDMVRDISERLRMFGAQLKVQKVALNMAQIETYELPPNPAKHSDPRAPGYVAEHGNESWELDALEPDALHDIVTKAIEKFEDKEEIARVAAQEEKERKYLERQLARRLGKPKKKKKAKKRKARRGNTRKDRKRGRKARR